MGGLNLTKNLSIFFVKNVLLKTFACADRANALFKKVHDGKNLRGRSNDAIAAACLYIACRQESVPRTFKVGFSKS